MSDPATLEHGTVTTTGAKPLTDPNVKLPKGVREASLAADQLHASIYGTKVEALTPENMNALDNPPADQTPPADPPADPPAQPQDNWEHSYKSLKGRYDKQQQAINELSQHVRNLEAAVVDRDARLAAAIASPPAAPAAAVAVADLTEQEIEEFGPELVAIIERKAKAIAANMTAGFQAKLDKLEQNVTRTTKLTAHQQKMADLDKALPNWREINDSDEFVNWLQLTDEYSGLNRHSMLTKAWDNNETSRVLAFFKGFIAEQATADPEPTEAVTRKVTPLEKLAAPGRAGGSGTQPPKEKPIITQSEIARKTRDYINGRISEADKAAWDKVVIEAANEGRVR